MSKINTKQIEYKVSFIAVRWENLIRQLFLLGKFWFINLK